MGRLAAGGWPFLVVAGLDSGRREDLGACLCLALPGPNNRGTASYTVSWTRGSVHAVVLPRCNVALRSGPANNRRQVVDGGRWERGSAHQGRPAASLRDRQQAHERLQVRANCSAGLAPINGLRSNALHVVDVLGRMERGMEPGMEPSASVCRGPSVSCSRPAG